MAFKLIAFILHILLALSISRTSKSTKRSIRLINRYSLTSPHIRSVDDDIRAPILPKRGGGIFLVNISVGDPPVPQLLSLDTGSYLVWVRCNTPARCKGCKNTFDPNKSFTYKDVAFDAPPCTSFDYGLDQDDDEDISPCSYEISYVDSSYSRGFLAFERYTFMTSTQGTIQVSDAVLGCAQETRPPDLGGVFGLFATSEHHLLARTGQKFSYCIGNISDPGYMYNQLILGDDAVIQGDSTPMQIKDYHYVLTLEGISVGDKPLKIKEDQFDHNIIIDSGATYTMLTRSAYEPLVAEVMRLADGLLRRARVKNAEKGQLCYQGNLERDLQGFPVVTLHLAEGADVVLDVEGLFRRSDRGLAFCLAIIESDRNVIGIFSQQYYNVGFDVIARRVSFQRIDCELLDD